ncbi:hypothetical protein [Roseibium sp. TrichSKD4]|uniref:hypothetical protein n=1 Tax=Roseibium sp. TrichSKD4 TaxID=744980 RepID=UPI00058BF6BA|nr:hypothetical protein [Roseibium sp. TrichSKD4]
MFKHLNSFTKFLILTSLCLFLAACQTTGLKPGSIQTNFPPQGWQTVTKGSDTLYLCRTCKTKQAVVITPAEVSGNVEGAIRANIISAGLISEIGKSASRASGGALKQISSRRITNANYSGIEWVFRVQARGEKPLYVAARAIVQNDRGITVASFAYSSSIAKSNLRRYLANTTIRRLP